jgi:predicted site-specific integrase-resolvase
MQTLNQRKLAIELGISTETISRLTKSGAITPVVKEGMLIRYDLDQVRQQLAERAKLNATTDQN